jgi:hypothetical protein
VPTGKESISMSIFPTTILLATDGSQDAELARTTAVDMATTDSELHVVTVAPRYPSFVSRSRSRKYSRPGARSLRGT